MPLPFRPAVMRGLARGLRVVEGQPSARARAAALRARTGRATALPRTLDVVGPGGVEKTWTAGAPERAQARGRSVGAQAVERNVRAEAARRHAESRQPFTLWKPDEGPPPGVSAEDWQAFKRESEARRAPPAEPEPQGPHSRVPDATSRDLYPELYGGRPGANRSAALGGPQNAADVADFLDRFERAYGYRPEDWRDAWGKLSPQAQYDLFFGDGE